MHRCSACDVTDCPLPMNIGMYAHMLQTPVLLMALPIVSTPKHSVEVPLRKGTVMFSVFL